jgi:hypothetical protein
MATTLCASSDSCDLLVSHSQPRDGRISLHIVNHHRLIPIPSIITPGTLSIQTAHVQQTISSMEPVPIADFVNPNFFAYFGGDNVVSYDGPSQLVQNIAAATATLGNILPITPPASNSSWSLKFWGPSIQCDHISSDLRTAAMESYEAYLSSPYFEGRSFAYSYVSWVGNRPPIPFTNSTGGSGLVPYTKAYLNQTTYMAFDGDYVHSYNDSNEADPIKSNMAIIQCDLFNSSYAVDFEFVNGAQKIIVSKPDSSEDNASAHNQLVESAYWS